MQTARLYRLSEAEYLEGERLADVRHEYVAGEVFAMTGTSRKHNTIALNLAILLRNALRGRGCGVFMSDLKVRVAAQSSYYYPDVVVTCAASDLADDHTEVLESPCLIVEVLSPSTAGIDRREKRFAYRQLDSLTDYLLVEQDTRRVELHRRTPEGWTLTVCDAPDDRLALMDGALDLPLTALYEDSGVE